MFAHFALTITVLTCLQYIGFVNTQATTCAQGSGCSSCSGNKVASLGSTQVCCPGCSSQYFNYGSNSNGLYCNCNTLRVVGNSSVGEACSASGLTTYLHLNTMPICCPDPYIAKYNGKDSNGRYMVDCILNGNCWRGSQCSSCNSGFVGSINGVSVCCANCQESGLILGSGGHCSCNN